MSTTTYSLITPTPESSEEFIHYHVWVVLSDEVWKYEIKNISGLPENEFVLVNQPIGHALCLLLPGYQITMKQMLETLTEPGDITNLFCTQFIRCVTYALVHLLVVIAQEAYNGHPP